MHQPHPCKSLLANIRKSSWKSESLVQLFPSPSPKAAGAWAKTLLRTRLLFHPCLPSQSYLVLLKVPMTSREPGQGHQSLPRQSFQTPSWEPSDHVLALQKMGELPLDINIQEPRWDQSTFLGRARHFFTVTDPRNLLLSGAQLEASRNIVQNYR